MELETAAVRLAELGNGVRLRIFRLLVKAGDDGLPVGEIQAHLGIPASTLSHHVSRLVWAGLVRRRREGRVLRCLPNYPALEELVEFLYSECCQVRLGPVREHLAEEAQRRHT